MPGIHPVAGLWTGEHNTLFVSLYFKKFNQRAYILVTWYFYEEKLGVFILCYITTMLVYGVTDVSALGLDFETGSMAVGVMLAYIMYNSHGWFRQFILLVYNGMPTVSF